jgi:hypothetical protein
MHSVHPPYRLPMHRPGPQFVAGSQINLKEYISWMINKLFEEYDFSISKSGKEESNVVSYRIRCIARDIDVSICWLATDDLEEALHGNIHKLISILINGVKVSNEVYDTKKLQLIIDNNYVQLAPEAKLDSILGYMSSHTTYDGQTIKIHGPDTDEAVAMYFANVAEWWFYFSSAVNQGLIKVEATDDFVNAFDPTPIYEYGLTVAGLSRLIRANEGLDSTYCFVAMAFDNELNTTYTNAIEPAIIKTGFTPLRVDKVHIQTDRTINDEIIAGIKKSKFVIADFTNHKNGVYFEAGYALGRGQRVIYTCREDEMNKAHFDIRNYQHIVWTDIDDFREKLINKIEAFIKD